MDGRDGSEESGGLVDREIQHIGDVLPLVRDLEGLAVKATPAAELALDKDIGQEMHLDPDHSIPFALFAATTLHIAGKAGRRISPHLRSRETAEKITDGTENSRIGGGI